MKSTAAVLLILGCVKNIYSRKYWVKICLNKNKLLILHEVNSNDELLKINYFIRSRLCKPCLSWVKPNYVTIIFTRDCCNCMLVITIHCRVSGCFCIQKILKIPKFNFKTQQLQNFSPSDFHFLN